MQQQYLVAPPVPSLTRITCGVCGIEYILTAETERLRRMDGAAFYCPQGHAQYFPQANHVGAEHQGLENLRGIADVQADQIKRMVAERKVAQEELECASRRLVKGRALYKTQQDTQDKLQAQYVQLQSDYAKSRRQIGGIAGDRTAFKELALSNLRDLKKSQAQITELSGEVTALTLKVEDATEAGDDLETAIAASQNKAVMARFLSDLLTRISQGGVPKGISEIRMIEYLTGLYEDKKA